MTTELPADLDVLQRLYSVPPPEFVEARTALVKERRAAKDHAGAIAIAGAPTTERRGLGAQRRGRRPSDGGRGLRRRSRAGARGAGSRYRGRAGADVRVALRELREHSGKVLAAARRAVAQTGRPADSQTAELSARLAELAGSTGATGQLRAGLLGLPRPDDDDDPFAGLEPAARQPRAAAAGRARPAGRTVRSSGSRPRRRPIGARSVRTRSGPQRVVALGPSSRPRSATQRRRQRRSRRPNAERRPSGGRSTRPAPGSTAPSAASRRPRPSWPRPVEAWPRPERRSNRRGGRSQRPADAPHGALGHQAAICIAKRPA